MNYELRFKRGFTLIEIMISLAIAAILAGAIVFFINPSDQMAKTRNTQRKGDIVSIANAIGARIADNGGLWSATCGSATTTLPVATTSLGTNPGFVDLTSCLVPAYLNSIPMDPQTGTAADTRYAIYKNSTSSLITVSALNSELGETISVTR